jgi:uncharacterized RDD family membrane protein YckC
MSSCPRCGWAQVEGTHCPRCGVDAARYRADLARVAAVPAPPAPAPPSAVAEPAAGVPVVAARRPAGFWIRVGAVLIDLVLVSAAEMLFSALVWALVDERLGAASSRAFRFLVGPCYFVFFHWARGQTPGKMAFQIRVVNMPDGPLSFGQAVLRHLGAWVSALILGLGYLFAAFRHDKRALHDLIARTRVEHIA